MDDQSVNWSQDRYNEIKGEIGRLLKTVGFNVDKIPFVPTSGWTGDNLVKPSEKMPRRDQLLLKRLLNVTLPMCASDLPTKVM
jgi:elongation factor 1-alpha